IASRQHERKGGDRLEPQKDKIKMVKTTINLPEAMWRDFAIKIIQTEGGRKKNEVIQRLIQKFLDGEIRP
ncbi:MAG: hypothetical protein KGI38_13185, partial [Thaumarchaeota archaeon]|nr:hypothetical protein [Nitrososphaerota archaeon]